MKIIAIVLAVLFAGVISPYAAETFMVSARIAQNDQIIASPEFLLLEAEEGQIEVNGENGYALSASVKKQQENIRIETRLYLTNNGSLETVAEPVFVVKAGEASAIEIDHPTFGNIVLEVLVNL